MRTRGGEEARRRRGGDEVRRRGGEESNRGEKERRRGVWCLLAMQVLEIPAIGRFSS